MALKKNIDFITFIRGKWDIYRQILTFNFLSQNAVREFTRLGIENKWNPNLQQLSSLLPKEQMKFKGVAECNQAYDHSKNGNYLYHEYLKPLKTSENNSTVQSKQKYIYYLSQANNQIVYKLFESGDIFEEINLNKVMMTSQKSQQITTYHLCNNDNYFGSYIFNLGEKPNCLQYSLIYRVIGPAKNYRVKTNFAKKLDEGLN